MDTGCNLKITAPPLEDIHRVLKINRLQYTYHHLYNYCTLQYVHLLYVFTHNLYLIIDQVLQVYYT